MSATSGRDTIFTGSTVVADKDIVIDAKRDLSIVSAEDSVDSESASSSKKSGSIGTRFQAAIGTVKTTNDGTAESVIQVGSQIASLGGNVTLKAGGQYTQTSSDITAPEGDISISAKDVLINAAMNTADSMAHQTYGKTAIGGSISVPLVDSLQSVGRMFSAGKDTTDGRMQTLAAVNAGFSSYEAFQQASALTNLYNQGGAGAAALGAGIKISISLGNSKSDSKVIQSSDTAVGSSISAGGNVSITATGGGKDSSITAIGADLTAGKDVSLTADNEVNLMAAENTASQHSTNKSSGASIGIGFAIGGQQNGFTLDFAASQARGNADGDDVTYSNTHVSAGNVVKVISGGDTNIKGGVITGKTVQADVGGDLNVESLQDSSKYDSKQSSSGVGISVCIPPVCYGVSGSVNISKSKANGDFLSVLEQSGINAGDGGFQLIVGGNTDLKGGIISSSDAAILDGKNSLTTGTLTTSDLANKSVANASSSGISLSTSMLDGKYALAKSLAGNAINNAGETGASAGATYSAVSWGQVTVKNDAKQQELTGASALETVTGLNRDTAGANKAADVLDLNAMQKEVEANKEIKKATFDMVTSYTDEAYSTLFEKKVQFYNVVCRDGQPACINDPNSVGKIPLTFEEAVKWGDYSTFNGILNDADRAAQLAYQNMPINDDGNKPDTIVLMYIPKADTTIADIMVAGYEKMLASTLGYSNADKTAIEYINARGDNISFIQSHSRGSLVLTNAMNFLGGNGFKSDGLSVDAVGLAVTPETFMNAALKVMPEENKRNVTLTYMKNDPISVLAAFNQGNIWASILEFPNVAAYSYSAHSCYGTGASKCVTIASPVPGGPVPLKQDNDNLVKYRGGILLR